MPITNDKRNFINLTYQTVVRNI